MNTEQIQKYLFQFSKLKRSATNGGAPHKPILLLSIISLIRKSEITSNRIEITPGLVLEFKSIWALLVVSQHTANFSLPFFHMRSEPFWRLVTKAGMFIPVTSSNSIKSLGTLKDSIAFAEVDKDLFDLLIDSVSSSILEEKLLEMYFPETKSNYRLNDYSFVQQLETQILHDDRESYAERISELRESLSNDEFEEEIFVRSGVFKREIPKIYDYQCAVSGMRVESTTNAQLVDACHIIPFAISKERIQMIRDKIGPVAAFKNIVVVKRLPKTRSGKILRGTVGKIADQVPYKMPATIDDPVILDEIKLSLIKAGIIKN